MKRVFQAVIVLSCCLLSCKKDGSNPTQTPAADYGTPTAVGTPIGSPSTGTIGPAGGSLLSPDGRSEIIIPPGALGASTQISIQPVTNQVPSGTGVGFSLTPNGQTFNQPVTLRFHCDSNDIARTDIHALGIATQRDNHIWYSSDTLALDSAARTVSVSIRHFSAFALFLRFMIVPEEADVQVNASQAMEVRWFNLAFGSTFGDGWVPLVLPIVPYPNGNQVSWTVNGVHGGDPANGLVSPASGSSVTTYTAPDDIHSMFSNPAAVTAEVNLPGGARLSLISNMKVFDPEVYLISVDLTATDMDVGTLTFNYSDHATFLITVTPDDGLLGVTSLSNTVGHINGITPSNPSCTITALDQGNLLDITRVEAYVVHPHGQPEVLLITIHSTLTFFSYYVDCGPNSRETVPAFTHDGIYETPWFTPDHNGALSFGSAGFAGFPGETTIITISPQ